MSAPAVALVSDIWRFPVKSFGGERLRRGFVGPFGLLGDRRHAVVNVAGEAMTARRAHALLGFAARYREGEAAEELEIVAPDGATMTGEDPGLADQLHAEFGEPYQLARSGGAVHDAAAIHIVSEASLRAIGGWVGDPDLSRLRFRPNLVVEADSGEPFAEDEWVGRELRVGSDGPLLAVVSPTERCAITTFDPHSLARTTEVLAQLARRRDNLFGVYAQVRESGWVAVGDPITIAAA